MSDPTVQGGSLANLNGHTFENVMIPLFKAHGFKVIQNYQLIHNAKIIKNVNRYVIRNAPFVTIYNQKGKTEFVIHDEIKKRAIRVENKWQQSAGSVDEKYPYMLLNGIYQYPENEIIFVVDGGGYKPGARLWLQNAITNDWLNFKEEEHKDIKLMTISEFITWFNSEF